MHAAFAFNAGCHIAERDRGAKCCISTSKDLAMVTPGRRTHNYPIVGTPFEGKAENPVQTAIRTGFGFRFRSRLQAGASSTESQVGGIEYGYKLSQG
ncbi:hypothetical protein AC628_08725 [Bradyrhizobium sp. NAS96.2]|nr:hypothetical protein AC628_08725 [Bradyrhizobium sp. NAS96.2]